MKINNFDVNLVVSLMLCERDFKWFLFYIVGNVNMYKYVVKFDIFLYNEYGSK